MNYQMMMKIMFFSYDSSCTDDDNNDYDENVDIDPLFEKQRNYYISTGITFHDTKVMTLSCPKICNLHPQLQKNNV